MCTLDGLLWLQSLDLKTCAQLMMETIYWVVLASPWQIILNLDESNSDHDQGQPDHHSCRSGFAQFALATQAGRREKQNSYYCYTIPLYQPFWLHETRVNVNMFQCWKRFSFIYICSWVTITAPGLVWNRLRHLAMQVAWGIKLVVVNARCIDTCILQQLYNFVHVV